MGEQLVLPGVGGNGPAASADQGPPETVPRLAAQSSVTAAMGAFETYMREQGFAENTSKAFLSDLNLLVQFLGAGTAVGDVSARDLRHFTYWLTNDREAPCSPKTLARRITTLKVFFGWLVEASILDADPSAEVVHRPVTSPLPRVLSESEIGRILAVTESLRRASKPDARPHLLVTLLLHTGIKKGECMGIVLNHLDFEDPAKPLVWIRYTNPARRHKERSLQLPAAWQATLAEYLVQYRPDDRLFPCTARNLEYVLSGVGETACLPCNLSFSMLRWTSAVRDCVGGMSEDALRQKLGITKITWREVGQKLATLAAATRSA